MLRRLRIKICAKRLAPPFLAVACRIFFVLLLPASSYNHCFMWFAVCALVLHPTILGLTVLNYWLKNPFKLVSGCFLCVEIFLHHWVFMVREAIFDCSCLDHERCLAWFCQPVTRRCLKLHARFVVLVFGRCSFVCGLFDLWHGSLFPWISRALCGALTWLVSILRFLART